MKKTGYGIILLALLLCACGGATTTIPTSTPTARATATAASTAAPTPLPTIPLTPTITPLYPPEGYGPANFPANVDPLTGLPVSDPALLQRRPMLIKVSNLPRNVRPQWGLSLADLIFEYYTEEGSNSLRGHFLQPGCQHGWPDPLGAFYRWRPGAGLQGGLCLWFGL